MLRTVFPESLAATQAQVVQTGRWAGELHQTRRDGGPSPWPAGGRCNGARTAVPWDR